MNLSNFDRFIGIDWSGAKDPRRGLQVAQCFQGTAVPQIVLNSKGRKWRRREVIDWLVQIDNQVERIIAGFDFAFAYPYCDKDAYFHKHILSPENVESLWKLIDSICREADDFYGGPFYLTRGAPFSDYLLYQTSTGKCYRNRMRITDNRCDELGGNPAPVFKCVGPDSVGIGSIAGMRLLHEVNSNLNSMLFIWPFQRENKIRSVIVEIFPRFFYILAGANPREWRNRRNVNNTLKYFGSEELTHEVEIQSEDQVDAIISAAAIRLLKSAPDTWQPARLNACARAYEGWIFGVV